jgi:hypothetical protein
VKTVFPSRKFSPTNNLVVLEPVYDIGLDEKIYGVLPKLKKKYKQFFARIQS